MTKKNELIWRLKERPTVNEITQLFAQKLLTEEEARQLLFNEGEDKGKKVKELEEEVRFLRDLCDKLAAKSNGWTTIVKEIQTYKPTYPYWYANYSSVAAPSTTVRTGALGLTSGTGVVTGASNANYSYSTTATNQMLGKLN